MNSSAHRPRKSRNIGLLVAALMLYMTLPISATQSALESKTGRLFGRIYDPNGTPIPDAVITVFDPDNNVRDITISNALGVFQFSGLQPGHYDLQTSAAGFESFHIQHVTVEVSQDVNLNILAVAGAAVSRTDVPPAVYRGKPVPPEVSAVSSTQNTEAGVIPPQLRRKVDPIYPLNAKDQRVMVIVRLDGLIGTDGVPKSMRVRTSGVDPELASAAVQAVKQWRYDPALFNGKPVEASVSISVAFFNTALVNSASAPEIDSSPASAAPVPAVDTPTRIRQSDDVQQSMLVTQVKPVYPQEAKAAGIQGGVILQARVGKDGNVEEVSVISGNPMLGTAAVDAVSQWKYKPTLLNGEPVEVVIPITVNFSLQQ